ncbi:PLP-dependent aminotransferase family protein [Brevibacterium oceani]|uniref:MocR-like transcription factor YczR n=1 Tax=Brevibacterium oceani TaxID=358099 RepID=UPI001FE8E025|nr:PLP-dependent aminotransferase family protein [Brevibacterium oceani]
MTTMSARRLAGIIGSGPWASPANESVAEAVVRAISDGRVPVGIRLPSERELAAGIGVSRTTTARVYARLREHGFIRTRRGSGSVVEIPAVPGGRIDHLLSPVGPGEGLIDLTCTATTAPARVREAFASALDALPAYLPGTGYYPSGIPALRELVADRFTARGAPTHPDEILITAGALGGAAVGLRALLTSPARVLIESPSYPNAIATIEAAGGRGVSYPLEIDSAGRHFWDTSAMGEVMRSNRVRSAYLIPDFHNPTGALLPEEQRPALAEELERSAVVPVFDESLVELGLDDHPAPTPMAALVPDSITVGSTSKIFWGGLRIGWMRIPQHRFDAVASARLALDLGAPVLEQLAAVELLRDHDAIVGDFRRRLRQARDRLAAAVRAHCPDWQVVVPPGGMALWVRLPEERSGALTAAAAGHGLALVSGPNFAPAGGLDGWIRLPYTVARAELDQVAPRLAAAWQDALDRRAPQRQERARIVA